MRASRWRTSSSPARARSMRRRLSARTALGVARRAAAAGVPCLAVGGGVTAEGAAVLAGQGCIAVPVVDRPMALRDAMAKAAPLVTSAGERLARLVGVGALAAERQASPA